MCHVTNLPCPLSHSISFSASYDLFIVCPIIEYVEITIEVPAFGLSFASEVNLAIISSVAVDHILNCARHCYEIIEFILIVMKTHLDSNTRCTPDVHRTIQRFRTVVQAVTPTKVLPAPHGRTITPDRARPLPNIFFSDFS